LKFQFYPIIFGKHFFKFIFFRNIFSKIELKVVFIFIFPFIFQFFSDSIALSFFKAPAGTISSIESLLINFFWGGGVRILGKYLGSLGKIFVCVGSMAGWG
jgi:hypothetical protein